VHRSQPLANDAGVTVVTTLAELGDPDGALEVMGDPVLLEAMVENLVRNAVRFSPRGGKVEVTVLVGAGSETITLRVRDHGAGIAAEDLTAVFDWFFDRPVREQRPTGTGFGLAIAKRVADHHGGTITARNRDAGGCELEVTLPRWRSEAGAGPSGPRQPGADPGAGTA
jgi:signal transduction histidine kinase